MTEHAREPTELVRSTAEVRTPKAAGYLAQLCKHFAHKIPASYEGNAGRISFARGECRLAAEGDVLTMTVEAGDPEALAQLQDVVARHLAALRLPRGAGGRVEAGVIDAGVVSDSASPACAPRGRRARR